MLGLDILLDRNIEIAIREWCILTQLSLAYLLYGLGWNCNYKDVCACAFRNRG